MIWLPMVLYLVISRLVGSEKLECPVGGTSTYTAPVGRRMDVALPRRRAYRFSIVTFDSNLISSGLLLSTGTGLLFSGPGRMFDCVTDTSRASRKFSIILSSASEIARFEARSFG
jgi:hypothetical protein